MVSGIPTASGYEERIRFSELEVVDRTANEQGLVVNEPEGRTINGWDVNVAAVRTTGVRRTVRYHTHAVCYRLGTKWYILTCIGICPSRQASRTTRVLCCTSFW